MLVAEILAAWANTGELSCFASAHLRLPLLVSEALKEHVLPPSCRPASRRSPPCCVTSALASRGARQTSVRVPSSGASPARSTRFPPSPSSLRARARQPSTTRRAVCSALSCRRCQVLRWRRSTSSTTTSSRRASTSAATPRPTASTPWTARDNRDDDLRAAAPYGGSGGGGGSSGKTALESDPKARLHIKASVKVLQVRLEGPVRREAREAPPSTPPQVCHWLWSWCGGASPSASPPSSADSPLGGGGGFAGRPWRASSRRSSS